MKNKRALIITLVWLSACALFAFAYRRSQPKPFVLGAPEVVYQFGKQNAPIKQESEAQQELDRREFELAQKRVEEAVERAKKEGRMATAIPVPPP